MTYDPFFGEREPAPAAFRRSDAAWAQVREDYLAGASAPQLAERYGVSVSALRKRAREEGWRRSDAPDAPAPDVEDDEAALAEAAADTPADLRPLAWARAALAVRRGRLQEALGWTRLVRQLDRMAQAQAASPALQARSAASLASAAATLAASRRQLQAPAKAPEVHAPAEAGAGAPPPSPAHPRAGGDPGLFQTKTAAAARANLDPRIRGDERDGADTPDLPHGQAPPVHEMHAFVEASGGAPPPIPAHPRACGDPGLFQTRTSPAPAANLGPRIRGDERVGTEVDMHGLHDMHPPEAAPPPRPTGPAVPPVPPDWVRWRLQAR